MILIITLREIRWKFESGFSSAIKCNFYSTNSVEVNTFLNVIKQKVWWVVQEIALLFNILPGYAHRHKCGYVSIQ
jgi:hypothetical protein